MKLIKKIIAPVCITALLTGCTSSAIPTGGMSDSTEQSTAAEAGTQVAPETSGDLSSQTVVYPVNEVYDDMDAQEFLESDAYWTWWNQYHEKASASYELQDQMESCYADIINTLLIKEEDENAVCSPLNLYVALAMLAEIADGNSRDQILDVLQVNDIGTLRDNIKKLWDANYADTPVLKSLLADSLWMRDGIIYNNDTLQTLAEQYHASSYTGPMGTEQTDQVLQDWMNENTGGLLEDYIKDIHTDPETVLALVSTIYFKAAWSEKFSKQATERGIFHGASGDTETDMMHITDHTTYYAGENFGAVSLSLNDSGEMYFFLPDEGCDVRNVVKNPETFKVLRGTLESNVYKTVNLSVPKFKAESRTDLMGALVDLGITDVMDAGLADFSPLTTDESLETLVLTDAEHTALVEIDEEGVTGAAYTIMMMEGAAMMDDEIIDFTLDRPFYFAVTGLDGSVLFAGIVQEVS